MYPFQKHFTQCLETDLLKSWQQNHNELNAERDEVWVPKCLHLAPTAKAKLNLLSAPLKLVSQDSGALSPIHHLSGDQRETPRRNEDQSHLHSHSNHQDPTIPLWHSPFHYITTVIPRKCKMPASGNYSFLQSLSANYSVPKASSAPSTTYQRKRFTACFTARRHTSASGTTCEHASDCLQNRPAPQSINRSDGPAEERDISITKVEFGRLEMSAAAQRVAICESKWGFVDKLAPRRRGIKYKEPLMKSTGKKKS